MKNLILITLCVMFMIDCVLITSDEENIRSKILDTYINKPKKELFKVYHFLYEKSYNLNSKEGIKRYNIFKKTLKFINEINSKPLNYKLGINQFSDMTNEEYKKLLNSKINISIDDKSIQMSDNNISVKDINWLNNLGDVEKQGSCVSDWAYATLGSI